MKQHEFIWLIRKNNIRFVPHDTMGNITIELGPHITITHTYKKDNEMVITFIEDQAKFKIPSKKELEHILRIYSENTNTLEVLREYSTASLRLM